MSEFIDIDNGHKQKNEPAQVAYKLVDFIKTEAIMTDKLNLNRSCNKDIEFIRHPKETSQTLPRNHNNSSRISVAPPPPPSLVATKPIGQLDYFDLDHSNPPPICNNSVSTSTTAMTSPLIRRGTGSSMADLPNAENGTVYKFVDFVKTEAIKQTLRCTELDRKKHLAKD